MKKIFALLLAVMLVFATCATSFAEISPTAPVYEESDTDSGSTTPPSDTSPVTGDNVLLLLSASAAFALSYAAVLAKKKASC